MANFVFISIEKTTNGNSSSSESQLDRLEKSVLLTSSSNLLVQLIQICQVNPLLSFRTGPTSN